MSAAVAAPLFKDVADQVGVDFVHFNGMSGLTYLPEMMGAGAALFDYDGDGDLDLYLVQGNLLGPERSMEQATFKPRHPVPLTDRLYRNRLVEDGALKFEDVTEAAGLSASNYGMGVAVGDVNGDGRPDLYLSNLGSNQLLVNRGDGRFEDVTEQAGVDDPRWSVQAVFFDFDGDGHEDIHVVNYVDFSFRKVKRCSTYNDLEDYCSPQSYYPVADRLLRNRGDGRFEDVSARMGIAGAKGHGLGAVAADFDQDGRLDLYVANDGSANFLWLNKGDRFEDAALLSGVSVNVAGMAEASMGVDAGDFDADGDLDLFMTHMERQTNTLYVNQGDGWFMDATGTTVLGRSSYSYTGFGALWFDYDNDGWLDLMSANGAVVKNAAQVEAGDPLPLRQSNQLWRNNGEGGFIDTSDQAGEAFSRQDVSRGAAFGDLDNDGDIDIVVTNNAGRPNVLINQQGQQNNWIGIVPLWKSPERIAPHTTAQVRYAGRTVLRRSRTDGSYVSAHDPRILIGLGDDVDDRIEVELTWPDGTPQKLELEPNRYHVVRPTPAEQE